MNCTAQSTIDTAFFIPKADSLVYSLKDFYIKKATAEKQLYLTQTKYNFLKFTPQLGYNVFNNSPMISINTADIFQNLNLKKQKEAQIKSIDLQNEVLFNSDIQEITHLLLILKNAVLNYNFKVKNFQNNIQINVITEQKYKNKEITPTEYYQHKINFDSQVNSLVSEFYECEKIKYQLLIKAKKADWVSLF